MIFVYLALIFAMAYLDRARGNPIDNVDKWAAIALSALCICIFLNEFSMTSAVLYIGYAAGASIGWGNAIGPALFNQPPDPNSAEWWQRGKLLTNAWYALVARGMLWSLCLLPGMYYYVSDNSGVTPEVIAVLLAYPIAMPMACYISYKRGGVGNYRWATQEYVRGGIVGLILFTGVLI